MNDSLPKLNLDLKKSRSPDLEIIDLDADDKDDDTDMNLSKENCNKEEEVGCERLTINKDRNNNSNGKNGGAASAAVGDQVKGLARCFRTSYVKGGSGARVAECQPYICVKKGQMWKNWALLMG